MNWARGDEGGLQYKHFSSAVSHELPIGMGSGCGSIERERGGDRAEVDTSHSKISMARIGPVQCAYTWPTYRKE